MTKTLVIRSATVEDATAVHRLMGQLGYALEEHLIADRLAALGCQASRVLFVACWDAEILGWVEACIVESLETGAIAEITGLVVDETTRGRGVGTALVERARSWAAQRGQSRLRVRTNVLRAGAAAFYSGRGFQEVKQQRVYDLAVRDAGIPGQVAKASAI